MNHDKFWKIIAAANLPKIADTENWPAELESTLLKLDPEEIVAWNHIFDECVRAAATIDLMAACCLINTGAGDDGFYYFRCWLVGMGRSVYEAAIINPDSLADHVKPGRYDAEAEIYAAAHVAWMKRTGKSHEDPYPARNEDAEITGDDWDFGDPTEMKRRFPRLRALFGE